MTKFAEELDNQLTSKQELSKDLMEKLEKSLVSNEILSSNRAMYHDVDMIAKSLATARKECDECRRKEYTLRVNIESLKRCLPRFLTKVTKVVHPIPTVEQLPDAVHKLVDEITKLIKYIGTVIIKDATPDDLAMLTASSSSAPSKESKDSKESNEVNSEIGRIRKLPGYQRLQKQLFINLMTARQDVTERNVRIYSLGKSNQNEVHEMMRPDTVYSQNSGNDNHDSTNYSNSSENKNTNGKLSSIPSIGDSLDRSTVKSISMMILDKNNDNSYRINKNAARR